MIRRANAEKGNGTNESCAILELAGEVKKLKKELAQQRSTVTINSPKADLYITMGDSFCLTLEETQNALTNLSMYKKMVSLEMMPEFVRRSIWAPYKPLLEPPPILKLTR
jgi:hypothetical protein